MFARGATPGKVDMWCYDEDDEDFTKGKLHAMQEPYLTLQLTAQTQRHLMSGSLNVSEHCFITRAQTLR